MTEEFGKYRILRHLANGGMATIWVAEQTGPEGFARYIAIKRLLAEFSKDETLREMFLDEARLASSLSHPNIGQIYELGEIDGEHYIAMEFIDGLSLEEVIASYEEFGPIPHDLAARIMVSILEALEHAHRATDRDGEPLQIIHRDVTPSNILVSNDGIPKLVDFGVAKAIKHKSATQTGAVKGKYAYMSPEQIEGNEVLPASDVFSAGITFFELLTGQKPFGEDLPAVSAILRNPTPDPRTFRKDIPESYARIAQMALEKELTHRYSSARGMLLDLETALRQRNAYITPLEVSVYIRTLRNLPIDVDASHEMDMGLFSADRSVETQFTPPVVQQVPNRTLDKRIIVGIGVAVALLIGLGIWALNSGQDVPPVTRIPSGANMVLSETMKIQADAIPSALSRADGRHVIIETLPEADLYHVGVFIGTTPIHTRLSPGFYRVELKLGDLRKRTTIEVKDVPVTRFFAELAELDDAPIEERPTKVAPKKAPAKKTTKKKR